MNRALIAIAGIAVFVLLACGTWLIVFGHEAPKIATVAHDSSRGTTQNEPAPRQAAPTEDAPSGPSTGSGVDTGSTQPIPAAPTDTTPKHPQPEPQRAPGTERPLPAAVEGRKMVNASFVGTVVNPRNSGIAADIYVEIIVQRRYQAAPDAESTRAQKLASSDARGTFTFRISCDIHETASLTARISPRAKGFAPGPPTIVDATQGGVFTVSLNVLPAGSLTGRITDTEGKAVAGVTVALDSSAGDEVARGDNRLETATDAAGMYAFSDVPARECAIRVLSPAHNYHAGPTSATVAENAATRLDDIVVELLTSIRMRITDTAGAGVQGNCVISFKNGSRVAQRLSAQTSDDGSILLAHPPVGTFDVTVKIEGYGESPALRLTFAQGQTTDAGIVVVIKDRDGR